MHFFTVKSKYRFYTGQIHKGAFINKITLWDLIDIYTLRHVLDPLAAGLAIGKVPLEEITAIEEKIQNLNRNPDWESSHQLSQNLHELIYRSCGNNYLREVYKNLTLKIEASRYYLWHMWKAASDRQAMERRKQEHVDIAHALRCRDLESAEKSSREHIFNVLSEIKKMV